MLTAIIRTVVAAAVSLFYRLERRGPPVPGGPVVLAANHPNSLLDPVIVFATAGRTPRPLAKAPLFERTVVGRLIRRVGGIPVYRREDDPGEMSRNEDTFRAAIAALGQGDAIQIFPEGRSHSDPGLSTLRTGAARIALAAESDADWTLGLLLMPVGLNYVRKSEFRGRAVAVYGDPIPVADYRSAFAVDAYGAARSLTAELERRLRALTLNLTRTEDAALIDAAERIWARETGASSARERPGLADRLPRLQAFARGLAWLRVHDPARHARLERDVARYARDAALLGAGEADVPERYPVVGTLRWIGQSLLPTLLLTPFALLAAAAWSVPYRLVGWAVGRMRLATDVVATYKLAASLIAYPLFLVLWVGLAAWLMGPAAAVAVALVLPVAGLVAIPWLDGARDVVEDLRLFGRVGRRTELRGQLRARRRALVAEFEGLRGVVSPAADPAPASGGGADGGDPEPR